MASRYFSFSKAQSDMKIAVIGPTYPFRGGIAHYTTLLVQHLRERHDVRLISYIKQYPKWLYPGNTAKDPSPDDSVLRVGRGSGHAASDAAPPCATRRAVIAMAPQSRTRVREWSRRAPGITIRPCSIPTVCPAPAIEPPRPDRPEPLRVRRWTGRAVLIQPEASRSSLGRPSRPADRSPKAS